jgi:hypothetical protein
MSSGSRHRKNPSTAHSTSNFFALNIVTDVSLRCWTVNPWLM